jgi:hypothetical protein
VQDVPEGGSAAWVDLSGPTSWPEWVFEFFTFRRLVEVSRGATMTFVVWKARTHFGPRWTLFMLLAVSTPSE